MANRVLRDWTTSEKIDALSSEAELFFVRLIMKADDHGCFHANPKLLKSALFPLREMTDSAILRNVSECEAIGIIELYEHDGRKYLKIIDFGQRLRNMVSKFPQPADNPRPLADKQRPETKRNETETNLNKKAQKIFGDITDTNFFRIQDKVVNSPITLIYGTAGWIDFLGATGGVLQYPEHALKFMRKYQAYQFFDSNHLHNTYMKFVEKQYA